MSETRPKTDYRDLETQKWCPICHVLYPDKSLDFCGDCDGVMLLQKFAYQFGYDEGFP